MGLPPHPPSLPPTPTSPDVGTNLLSPSMNPARAPAAATTNPNAEDIDAAEEALPFGSYFMWFSGTPADWQFLSPSSLGELEQ